MALVEIRWKVKVLGEDLVSPAVPIKARKHRRYACGDVLLHDHFARLGADDAANKVAHCHRHLPPALFPGANSSRLPGVRVFLHTLPRPPWHSAERMADHVNYGFERRKFLAPNKQIIHVSSLARR